jgi:hypothetical protein
MKFCSSLIFPGQLYLSIAVITWSETYSIDLPWRWSKLRPWRSMSLRQKRSKLSGHTSLAILSQRLGVSQCAWLAFQYAQVMFQGENFLAEPVAAFVARDDLPLVRHFHVGRAELDFSPRARTQRGCVGLYSSVTLRWATEAKVASASLHKA